MMATLTFLVTEILIGLSLFFIGLILFRILIIMSKEHAIMFPKRKDEVSSPGVKKRSENARPH
jgi:hypothetical protein